MCSRGKNEFVLGLELHVKIDCFVSANDYSRIQSLFTPTKNLTDPDKCYQHVTHDLPIFPQRTNSISPKEQRPKSTSNPSEAANTNGQRRPSSPGSGSGDPAKKLKKEEVNKSRVVVVDKRAVKKCYGYEGAIE